MDVASWLRSLGLEQYEATFRDNAIDGSVQPDLTDQDLEKLGVLLGHRHSAFERPEMRYLGTLPSQSKASRSKLANCLLRFAGGSLRV